MFVVPLCSSESRTERREPVHAGKTPSSPLSPTSLRLLMEFGLRYGVVGSICQCYDSKLDTYVALVY